MDQSEASLPKSICQRKQSRKMRALLPYKTEVSKHRNVLDKRYVQGGSSAISAILLEERKITHLHCELLFAQVKGRRENDFL